MLLLACAGAFAALPASAAPRLVAPSVYVEPGDNGDITADNRGRVANAGFIVGARGVLVIDSGVSFAAGTELLAAIAKLTPKPVELAVLTHASQEFIFGAKAFQQQGIPVLMHRDAAALMRERCGHCLNNLRQMLGEQAMQGSAVITPDRLLDGATVIDLGAREVEVLHLGWASSPGDLALFDRRSGTLFAGGLVLAGRIPTLRDAQLDGWISALKALQKLPVRRLVPGFGPVGTRAEIDRMLDYLQQLDATVRMHYRGGDSLLEAMRNIVLPPFRDWHGYGVTHPQNVLYVYRRLEDAEFR